MCAAKKTEEAAGPSILGILFSAIIVALFGALLGFLYLSTYPPVELKSQEGLAAHLKDRADKAVKPGDVYYLKGATQYTSRWEAKRQRLLAGQGPTISLADSELNAWFASKFRAAPEPKGDDQPKLLIIPDVPNIYFSEARVYISLPIKVVVYGERKEYTVFGYGHFTEGSSPEFTLDKLYLNNASVPGFLGKQIMNKLLQAYRGSEEYMALEKAWSEVQSASVRANAIHLQLR